jgi:hypothetical protein
MTTNEGQYHRREEELGTRMLGRTAGTGKAGRTKREDRMART